MSEQFDWHIGEDEDAELPEPALIPPSRLLSPVLFFVATAVLLGVLIGGWRSGQQQLARSEDNLLAEVQTLLDMQHDAFLRGDADLFFSVFAEDDALRMAQLQLINQSGHRVGLEATRVRMRDGIVWANLGWTENGVSRQRIAFFSKEVVGIYQTTTDRAYWGKQIVQEADWGHLRIYEADQNWAGKINRFIANRIKDVCQADCIHENLPLTVVVRDDFKETAVANQIHLPSPRLLALDENGDPDPIFWERLERQITDRLVPATIHFAVLDYRVQEGETPIDYNLAAARFMEANPHIHVEIVTLENWPTDLTTLALDYDGAAVSPTEAMITQGLIQDLTDYINSDISFEQGDFYEQIWQGANWQDRIWFMPQAARMRVLFYDKGAYQHAGLPEPSLRWTWDEMAYDIIKLGEAQPADSYVQWGFLDTSLDSLYSYAFNWNNHCTEAATIFCQSVLQPSNVAASLDWYQQLTSVPGSSPDLSQFMNEADRQFVMWAFQGAKREAAIWADLPNNYESQLLLEPIGVVPFPGSDRFDGITPLWVSGSFMSSQSERPYATWQWLKFLSHQRPPPRMIPARPSVANATGYWNLLPRDLGNVMRTAFPFARPVTIADRTYLSWAGVTAVISGEATPSQAGQRSATFFNPGN
ncbi:MAG: extracellular solute-binding protein [Chloroflexi bacterium]|nr:extracellular solute-binding protein [Chloroflexota bacterium]